MEPSYEQWEAEQKEVEAEALAIWQNGTNDEVWAAVFDRGIDIAGELLERIRAVPDFTVGDLTHEQVIAAIERRYPILGPNPEFGR